MKVFEYDNYQTWLSKHDMENIFHTYVGENDELYYNICRSLNFKNLDKVSKLSYTIHTVTETDTWNLLSFRYYGTIRLWWLICKFNGITNAVEEPVPGTNLRILKSDIVADILKLIKKA